MAEDLAAALRQGMRRVPAGVSILTTQDDQGEPFAMTVSSMTSVSDAPPSLLVCVNRNSRISAVLSEGQVFATNVLGQSHVDASIACSTGEQSNVRFQVGDWVIEPGQPPRLKDAEAVFVCTVDNLTQYGTHTIVVGKLKSANVGVGEANPLVYLDGSYRQLAVLDK